MAAYYGLAWLIVGRRRRDKSIAVRYQPPDQLSPAAVRYVYTMHSDGRTYAAIVAQLAARRLLAIGPGKEHGAIYVEKLAEDHHRLANLPEEEKLVFKDLLEFNDRVALRPPQLRDVERIQTLLEKQIKAKYFSRNLPWVVVGLILTAAAAASLSLASGIFGSDKLEAWTMATFSGLTVAMYGLWGYWIWDTNGLALMLALRGLYHRRTLPVLLAFVFVYPALWYVIIRAAVPGFAVITTLLILINSFSAPCLRNYTAVGRRVRNEIEGFRQFLQGTEQDRLQRMNPGAQPAAFDTEFIPYAIALDLREAWGDELGIKTMVETEL